MSAFSAFSELRGSSSYCDRVTQSGSFCGPSSNLSRYLSRKLTFLSHVSCNGMNLSISGSSLRLSSDSNALLHLRHHWHAGKIYKKNSCTHGNFNGPKYETDPALFFGPFKVFGSMAFEPDSEYNRHNHFQTFIGGILVLFR